MPENSSESMPEAARAWRRATRRQLLERRLGLAADDCARFSAAVRAHLREAFPQLAGMRVGFCWPLRNEPDLLPLIAAWAEAGQPGFAALLPVVVGAAMPLAFRAWTPATPMIADRYGIPTPADGEFLTPEALLIPANAFDADGYRLGYGGGFFDRTLAALRPRPLAIGVGYELARVASIRPAAHDMRLDAVVTEAGVIRFR